MCIVAGEVWERGETLLENFSAWMQRMDDFVQFVNMCVAICGLCRKHVPRFLFCSGLRPEWVALSCIGLGLPDPTMRPIACLFTILTVAATAACETVVYGQQTCPFHGRYWGRATLGPHHFFSEWASSQQGGGTCSLSMQQLFGTNSYVNTFRGFCQP